MLLRKNGLKYKTKTLLALSSVALSEGVTEIQILPYGEVKSKRGNFKADAAGIAGIIDAFKGEKNDLVIDYEHQTLAGGEAPAAGWIKELTNKGEGGLWAKVEWTDRAADYIKKKEYRYLSPVIGLDGGKVTALYSAGLTNTPAIDGMTPVANKIDFGEDTTMEELVKELIGLLGLAETATAEDIAGAVKALKEGAAPPPEVAAYKEVVKALGLKEDAKADDARGAVLALKNPSGFVKAEDFKALKDKLDVKERDDLVALALTSGKVAPANKDWAEGYALKDPAGFKKFLEKAPVVVPLKDVAAGIGQKTPAAPDGVQLAVNKALKISAEDFKKYSKNDGEDEE
jgi:phage I-like protein